MNLQFPWLMSRLVLCLLLLNIPFQLSAQAAAWPVPVAGWSATTQGNAARPSTPLAPGVDALGGVGSAAELNVLQLVGGIDPKRPSPDRVYWLRGSLEPAALALGTPKSVAQENAVLEGGSDKSLIPGLDGGKMTIFMEFKLVAPMSETGNPKYEEDGMLLSLGPDVSLMIAGRGREGKARRWPSLRVKEKSARGESLECTYTARLEDELQLGQ